MSSVVASLSEVVETSLTGQLLLDNPLLNKGSAFSEDERREFGLLGLLPSHYSTFEEQLSRTYENYRRKETDLERYVFLTALQDRNEICSAKAYWSLIALAPSSCDSQSGAKILEQCVKR